MKTMDVSKNIRNNSTIYKSFNSFNFHYYLLSLSKNNYYIFHQRKILLKDTTDKKLNVVGL